jgi:hypothetical protein
MKSASRVSALFLLIGLGVAPSAKATFVQGATQECSGSTSACVATFAGNIAAGDGIFGGCNPYGGNPGTRQDLASVIDSAGSSYTLGTRITDTGGANASAQPAWTFITGSGSGKTVTANYSPAWNPPGGGFVFCSWEEVSSPPNTLDVTAIGTFALTSSIIPHTAAVMTNHANELLVSIVQMWNPTGTCTGGPDGQTGTFTMRSSDNFSNVMDISESLAASYSASVNVTSCNSSGQSWVAYLLAFYTASAPPPAGHNLLLRGLGSLLFRPFGKN